MNKTAAALTAPGSVRFPAFTFSQGLVHVIASFDAINRSTRLGFKSGYFKRLVVVDSEGYRFRVVGAKKIRTVMDFSFRGLFELVGWNPTWIVELQFAPEVARISLEDVKALLMKCFRQEKYLWEEMTDFEEFQERIGKAGSLEQIFSIFGEFNESRAGQK